MKVSDQHTRTRMKFHHSERLGHSGPNEMHDGRVERCKQRSMIRHKTYLTFLVEENIHRKLFFIHFYISVFFLESLSVKVRLDTVA